jgi:ParB-like chromosome segregation protein Spo0J
MILEPKPKKVKIVNLKMDPNNPKELSQEQMHALRVSMEKFGFLHPIIVDRTTNIIADGEHHVLVYKEFNKTEIMAYMVEFEDDAERSLLRQTMNKLKADMI